MWWTRWVNHRVREIHLEVKFHPADLPLHVERFVQQAGAPVIEPVPSGPTAHLLTLDSGPWSLWPAVGLGRLTGRRRPRLSRPQQRATRPRARPRQPSPLLPSGLFASKGRRGGGIAGPVGD